MTLRILLGAIVIVFSQSAPIVGAEKAPSNPRSGDVYKEFVLHNSGDRAWRVPNPAATNPGARKFLPNPILELEIDDLDGAVRAEVLLDRWGGHLDTTNPAIRFNEHDWLAIPPPGRTR